MNLSNAEQTQKDNFGPSKEYVRRLKISPLDTIWIARLEGSIEKRLIGYVDNHNTGVRRLDLIALPGEYIMITRKESNGAILHQSKQVYKVGLKDVFEANSEQDRVFYKVDLGSSYYSEMNKRLLQCVIGEKNLVNDPVFHKQLAFNIFDVIKPTIFQTHIGYRTDGSMVEVVKASEWQTNWNETDKSVYMFVPFINIGVIRILMQDVSKHEQWMGELANRLVREGFTIEGQSSSTSYTYFSMAYPLPEQLFNVK